MNDFWLVDVAKDVFDVLAGVARNSPRVAAAIVGEATRNLLAVARDTSDRRTTFELSLDCLLYTSVRCAQCAVARGGAASGPVVRGCIPPGDGGQGTQSGYRLVCGCLLYTSRCV